MTQDTAPAGWYDDPAGGGGRRYWDGHAWTDRVQGGASSRSTSPSRRERIPDGFMALNGHLVRIGETTTPPGQPGGSSGPFLPGTTSDLTGPGRTAFSGSSDRRALAPAAVIVLAVLVVLGFGRLAASVVDSWDSPGGSTVVFDDEHDSQDETYAASPLLTAEVSSENDSTIDIALEDGELNYHEVEGVFTPWEFEFESDGSDGVRLSARPTDEDDVVTCRILDDRGNVLDEHTSESAGEAAICRHWRVDGP